MGPSPAEPRHRELQATRHLVVTTAFALYGAGAAFAWTLAYGGKPRSPPAVGSSPPRPLLAVTRKRG
eukprot:scaffold20855_cov118-Isochrysis_galbana.AAC.1